MWWRTLQRAQADTTPLRDVEVLALEDNAARAGYALACSYATSQEYEAELIAERRAAGVYRTKHGWGRFAGIAAAIAVIVGLVLIIR
jgi:hypothetical protein